MGEMEDKITAIFDAAGLSDDDRLLWLSRLSRSGERFQYFFIESFDGEPDMLEFFTSDLRKRIEAGNDPEKLFLVLAEEKEYFSDILNKES
jgi:hypothetical protein